jgi:hypothetical protein
MSKRNHAVILRNKERNSLRSLSEDQKSQIWKEITGYSGKFQISNLGNVCMVKSNFDRIGLPQSLFHKRKLNSFLVVYFNIGGKRVIKFAHELVAKAFVANHNNLKHVKHKNGNIYDNRACNLEWT